MLGNGRILAALVGFGTYALVLHGSWVAVMLYAYEEGGVGEAGLVSFAVLAPAAIFGPFVAVWFGRLAPNRSLAGGLAAQGAFLALVAFAVSFSAPSWFVYLMLTVHVVAQMASRPTMASILPKIVDEPAELAAANSSTELIDTLGLVLGPALAGVVLLNTDSLAVLFHAAALLLGFGAIVSLAVGRGGPDEYDGDTPLESITADVMGGLVMLRREKPQRYLVVLLAAVKLIVGTLDVAVVSLALDQLGEPDATAGFLGSALGVGGIVGAALSLLLIGRRRLTAPIVLGLLMASTPIIVASVVNSVTPMFVLFVLAGLGRPVLAVAGRTLLQGLSSEDTLAQLFGFLEGLSILAVGIGSGVFSILAVTTSLSTALVLTGLTPVVLLGLLLRPVLAIDRDRPIVDRELLATVRAIPIFSTLPAFRLEQLLVNMRIELFEPETAVFELGDHGDQFFIVAEGEAIVELPEFDKPVTHGGFFGEIALLRDQPRMATVRVGSDGLRAHVLDRDVFLAAVSSAPSSGRRAARVIERRLAEGRGPEDAGRHDLVRPDDR